MSSEHRAGMFIDHYKKKKIGHPKLRVSPLQYNPLCMQVLLAPFWVIHGNWDSGNWYRKMLRFWLWLWLWVKALSVWFRNLKFSASIHETVAWEFANRLKSQNFIILNTFYSSFKIQLKSFLFDTNTTDSYRQIYSCKSVNFQSIFVVVVVFVNSHGHIMLWLCLSKSISLLDS